MYLTYFKQNLSMKKISLIVFIILSTFLSTYAIDTNDNPVLKAFEERKQKVVNIIEWDELTQQINKLKETITKINTDDELNQKVIEKINNDIVSLEDQYNKLKEEIKNSQEIDQNIEKLAKELEDTIKSKQLLLEKLQKQSEENQIQKEKLNLLLEKYSAEKQQQEEQNNQSDYVKYIIFFSVTLWLWLIYFIINFLYKRDKISRRVAIYTNFFLIFGYTIFLIWFFFYLHPELSIFLIFISGYLLAINAHLIASFIWSILILKRFQIWDVIKLWDFRWQIIRITTINTILLPISEEGILTNKPIIIPNVELLKNTVIKDEWPETFLYEYEIKLPNDTKIDIMKMVEHIEQNILLKRLNNRLASLVWWEDSFRTSMWFDKFWRIFVKFIWRWDDILNKQIERKIMWYITKLKKDEREEEERKKEEEKKLEEQQQNQQEPKQEN